MVDDTDEQHDSMLHQLYNKQPLSGKPFTQIRIKLIISETSKNELERSMKKLVSPFFNLAMGNYADYGMFHIAVCIQIASHLIVIAWNRTMEN